METDELMSNSVACDSFSFKEKRNCRNWNYLCDLTNESYEATHIWLDVSESESLLYYDWLLSGEGMNLKMTFLTSDSTELELEVVCCVRFPNFFFTPLPRIIEIHRGYDRNGSRWIEPELSPSQTVSRSWFCFCLFLNRNRWIDNKSRGGTASGRHHR